MRRQSSSSHPLRVACFALFAEHRAQVGQTARAIAVRVAGEEIERREQSGAGVAVGLFGCRWGAGGCNPRDYVLSSWSRLAVRAVDLRRALAASVAFRGNAGDPSPCQSNDVRATMTARSVSVSARVFAWGLKQRWDRYPTRRSHGVAPTGRYGAITPPRPSKTPFVAAEEADSHATLSDDWRHVLINIRTFDDDPAAKTAQSLAGG